MVVGMNGTGFTNNFQQLLICEAITGMGMGSLIVPFDLMAEICPSSVRTNVLIFFQLCWSVGSIFAVCVSGLLMNTYGWRTVVFASSWPSVVAVILGYFFISESPRWLLAENRVKEAEEILNEMREMNTGLIILEDDKQLTDSNRSDSSLYYHLRKPNHESQNDTIWELFEFENYGGILTMWLCWFSQALTIYGILFFLYDYFAVGDTCSFQYSYLFLFTILDALGIIMGYLFYNLNINIKLLLRLYFLITAISLGIAALTTDGNSWIFVLSLIIAKLFVHAGNSALWWLAPIYFPTKLRSTGHSFASASARVGVFAAILLSYSGLANWLIIILLGSSSFIVVILVYFLWEIYPGNLYRYIHTTIKVLPILIISYVLTYKYVYCYEMPTIAITACNLDEVN
jgi:MFS family permease